MAGRDKALATGLVFAAAGSIAFSGKAVIVKLAYRYGVDAVTVIMLRMLFALPIFLAIGWWASRGKPRLTGRDKLEVAALGFTGYYFSSMLDFLGLQFISASFERLILYLNPTFVLLLGWLFFGRRGRLQQLLGMAVSYCGVLLVLGHELRLEGANVSLGAALVLGSAASYAVYMVYSGELVKRLGSLRLVSWATSVACACCIAQYLVLRPVAALETLAPQVVWLSLANAVACTAVPVLLVMMAIERIGPALSAQTGMIGPLSTIALSVWLLDEPFTAWLLAGTALVLAGIYVFTRAPTSAAPKH